MYIFYILLKKKTEWGNGTQNGIPPASPRFVMRTTTEPCGCCAVSSPCSRTGLSTWPWSTLRSNPICGPLGCGCGKRGRGGSQARPQSQRTSPSTTLPNLVSNPVSKGNQSLWLAKKKNVSCSPLVSLRFWFRPAPSSLELSRQKMGNRRRHDSCLGLSRGYKAPERLPEIGNWILHRRKKPLYWTRLWWQSQTASPDFPGSKKRGEGKG